MNYLHRKKLAFMSIVNQVKGFVRTVSGLPPITLESCVDDKSVINYQIYGNSVQDGEPTPDNPVEIVSVGERTSNIFDYKTVMLYRNTATDTTITQLENGIVIENFEQNANYFSIRNVETFLKPNTTYTVTMDVYEEIYQSGGGSGGSMSYCWHLQDNTSYSNNAKILAMGKAYTKGHVTTTFTTPENFDTLKYLATRVGGYSKVTFANIHFKEGDTAAEDYEPYGYKIPITASGKNLFDISAGFYSQYGGLQNEVIGNSLKITCSVASRGSWLNIGTLSAGTYTLSVDSFIKFADGVETDEYLTVFVNDKSIKRLSGNIKTTFTLTDTSEVSLYATFYNTSDYALIKNVLICEGDDVATDYEPYHEPITTNIYLNEPLAQGQTISYKEDNLPDLPTFKGTTIYTIDTTVQPTMEVTYYSTVKE